MPNKIVKHTKKYKNVTHNQEKNQSIETDTKMMEIGHKTLKQLS